MFEPQNADLTSNKSPMMAYVELVSGFWISQAMNVAAKLGVADLLTEGAKSVDELAQATESHAPSLYRVLRTLASVGVFTEVESHRFALTPIGQYLCTDNPYSLRYQAVMHGDEWHWRTFGEMFRTVKDGKPAIHHLYQVDSYWQHLEKNPESQSLFNQAMINVAKNYHTPFIESYDFSSFTKIVDVAGGEGRLISSILKANPHLQGILYDMPQTVAQATKILEQEGVADRCETVGGDIFNSVPAGGDLYSLSYIFLDWDDDSCIKILQNIRATIPDHGKLLIIDSIVPIGDQHSWVKWVDLFELCMGYGRARTEEEFRAVFQSAGFQLARIFSMDTPCSLMELLPV